jgi:hypothetical protein
MKGSSMLSAIYVFRAAVIAGMLVAFVGVTDAATLTYTGQIVDQNTDYEATPFINVVPLKFNSSLGTLRSVDVSYAGSGTGQITFSVSNNGGTTAQVRANADLDVNLGSTDAELSALLSSQFLQTATAGSKTTSKSIGVGQTVGFGPYTWSSVSLSQSYTSAADLALFTGTGSLGLFADTSTTLRIGGTGAANTTTIVTSQYGLNATVTYHYDVSEVPEPSTLALAGLGVTGVVIARRRRRRV